MVVDLLVANKILPVVKPQQFSMLFQELKLLRFNLLFGLEPSRIFHWACGVGYY